MNVFHDYPHPLAEGPLWLPHFNAFFWVDIIEQRICGKKFTNMNEELEFDLKLEQIPTALLHDSHSEKHIWIVTDKGLLHWQIEKNQLKMKLTFEIPDTHRTNDAGVDGSGNLWIGVMQKNPTGKNGWVFVIDNQGKEVSRIEQIGIANTFCYLPSRDTMLISDSFQQITYEVPCSENMQSAKVNMFDIWQDLRDFEATPDGGCIDKTENVWNAHWDGYRVRQLTSIGVHNQDLQVPAKQITSCCFGGPNMDHILVTSAIDNLPSDLYDKQEYQHGRIFITEVKGHKGTLPNGFGMKVIA